MPPERTIAELLATGVADQVRNPIFVPLADYKDHFTKTGSGQT
jgi:hypothetical protein